MDQVLIIDTETTGLDPEKDHCIEVAAIRYSLLSECMIGTMSTLINSVESNQARSVNRIPDSAVVAGEVPEAAWSSLAHIGKGCDAVLAHNADFDRSFIPASTLSDVPWICTMDGVPWPLQTKPGASLVVLALEHGLGVVDPHRALNDCLLLARLLTRCADLGIDLNMLLAPGLRPRALFQAVVSYDDKEKAREAGFRWDAATKRWLRKLAIEEAGLFPFPTRQVDR